ncbi:SPOC domain-like protein [Delitschia confertaspora ATCC 74209]|uniref:ATP-dependent DNA helicase II subunit 2 n=1 Tax=Delitschia confertaspora ATCC 74209 TaxID=1513339 RepID=A0A9P4JP67_9PLEO|nr:SPOC domain-like protein [Delitschia confertaspora ATCC 74209]
MAGKEATVYIVDLGRSMSEKRHGRRQTNLEWSMEYVWDKITSTVSTGRKTTLVGVVGFRTNDTNVGEFVDDSEGYENISILTPLKQFLLPDIRALQNDLKPSKTDNGDVTSALVIAIQMISEATSNKSGKPLKYDRRIIMVTDGFGPIHDDDLDGIASKIKDDEIELTLLGVDFDDEEYGFKEEDKAPEKAENERILKQLVDDCGGNFGTLAEAVEQTALPRVKEVRPTPNYKGTLTLGNPADYDATLTIDVERYPCTMIAKPPTASRFVVRTDLAGALVETQSTATVVGDDHDEGGQLAAVRNQRVYKVENPDEPGAMMNVEPEDLEKGYEYGRTAVHISESDSNVVKLETEQGLEIIGFVHAEKTERYLPMSRTNYIIAQKTNSEAKLALSSLIHALYETECHAIARLVAKEGKPPCILLLTPFIELDTEALIDVELPFAEDMRRYKFPSLDKKLTVSGKVITEHRDIPNEGLMKAMSDYVDAMDLSTFGKDEDGNSMEYMQLEETYSPLLHRINHIIRWRATHDTYTSLPEPPAVLMEYSVPPADLIDEVSKQLITLKQTADVKRVPPKQKGRGKRNRDHDKPLSGLDVDALLGKTKRVKIDPQNLVPSFKQALSATDELEGIQAAADEMGAQIRSLITTSFGESNYGRATEAIRVMREELIELEEPEIFNTIIKDLKKQILGEDLGGERREMWLKIRDNRIGLIDNKRSMMSDVQLEEAEEFYRAS